MFFVNGNPWCVEFRKKFINGQDWLSVYLHSGSSFSTRIEQLIIVSCDFQLIKPSLKKGIRLLPYSADNLSWEIEQFIPWYELINNVDEDECDIQIRLKATKTLNSIQNEWLQFQTLRPGHAASDQHKKFRMMMYKIHLNDIGVCSPNIKFIGHSWRIAAEITEGQFVVKILNTKKNTCRISSTIKLIPFDSNVQPVEVEFKNNQFNAEEFSKSCKIISWNELIDGAKKFMQDDGSLAIEVDLIAGTGVGDEPQN